MANETEAGDVRHRIDVELQGNLGRLSIQLGHHFNGCGGMLGMRLAFFESCADQAGP